MMRGTVYLIKETRGVLSIETKDRRFIRLNFRIDHRLYTRFKLVKIGDLVIQKSS